ncbi:hypothetical protein TNCV_860821 [Trichonephila clavipes]|nr:hypothetical protein TNCV_860821 [Trichonephila clavipes]
MRSGINRQIWKWELELVVKSGRVSLFPDVLYNYLGNDWLCVCNPVTWVEKNVHVDEINFQIQMLFQCPVRRNKSGLCKPCKHHKSPEIQIEDRTYATVWEKRS